MNKYKGYLMFDFDSVISSYKRPWKFDKFGKPAETIREVMSYYYESGYWIGIFTGRMATPKLKKWLDDNNFEYHAINRNPERDDNVYHNSRFKPYYDVIIDDKAVNFHEKHNNKSFDELCEEIERILKVNKEGKEDE